jgi:hypothetical protein
LDGSKNESLAIDEVSEATVGHGDILSDEEVKD